MGGPLLSVSVKHLVHLSSRVFVLILLLTLTLLAAVKQRWNFDGASVHLD